MVSTFLKRLWNEPVLAGAVAVAALNAGLFLPDWKAAAASVAASIGVGIRVRSRVSPTL
jgi:threonine/homoserine efflux transporter RhtA